MSGKGSTKMTGKRDVACMCGWEETVKGTVTYDPNGRHAESNADAAIIRMTDTKAKKVYGLHAQQDSSQPHKCVKSHHYRG